MAAPKPVAIELSDAEVAELASRRRRRKVARADALRAKIVLLAAEGISNLAIAERLGMTRVTVATWRCRFAERRLDGLLDEPRPRAPRAVTDQKVADVVTATLETLSVGRTHWSSRGMARASGLAPSTVQHIWKAFPLQPHRSETFKLSTDPLFVDKVRDIVGLYLNPPDRAVVLYVDEKSQVQALDRTQPILPLRPGQAELISFFSVVINTVHGVSTADREMTKAGRSLHLSPWQDLEVVLMSAVPDILVGLRYALGAAWGGVVLSELVAGDVGIGALESFGGQSFDVAQIMVGMITLAALGYFANLAFVRAQARLFPWIG